MGRLAEDALPWALPAGLELFDELSLFGFGAVFFGAATGATRTSESRYRPNDGPVGIGRWGATLPRTVTALDLMTEVAATDRLRI